MRVIDSHTGGEPTRVVLEGGPDLGPGPLSERRARFASDFDPVRRQLVLEPKCPDSTVGALLCAPADPTCSAGVIFFNKAGYLGMCGHGLMGLMVTLHYLSRIQPGRHRIETPVGVVEAELLSATEVCVRNVESYRLHKGLRVQTEDFGVVIGDVAWGGNWFFLAYDRPCRIDLGHQDMLLRAAVQIRNGLIRDGVSGEGEEIDHIEFFQPGTGGVDSKNYVMCPGEAYDRSPCGTGTSAKLACLAADGALDAGQIWIQESLVGSRFKGWFEPAATPGRIVPFITGDAHVFADTRLILRDSDPFLNGIG